ncbi:radical SAM protein [Tissierella creatinini]|nr:radical SAM protein [Tissierella creatinini]TJX60373.1 radical SAM protein [Soehngenia saccharolytica]
MDGISLNLILTYKCNYECDHCISNCSPSREETMKIYQAKEYIDKVVSTTNVNQIGYTGGEPFLYYEMLKELIGYSYNEYGIAGGVVTNCFWAKSEKEADHKLEELYNNGLRSIVVSCDSYHLKYGSIKPIEYVVHKSLDLGLTICINTVVTKDVSISKNDIPRLLKLTDDDMENGIIIKEIGLLRLGRTLTHIPEDCLIETEDEMYFNGACPFVLKIPTITPRGSVYSCCCFGDDEVNPTELIGYGGNVNHDSIENILTNMEGNLLFNIFKYKGPYSLLKTIKERRSDIEIRGKYLSNCDICVELYHNPQVKEELKKLLREMAYQNL